MSATVTIAKLESLLARVVARAAEPRSPRVAFSGAAAAPELSPPGQLDEMPTTPPPAMPSASLDEPDVDLPPAVEAAADNGPDIVIGEATASDDLLDEVSDSRERLVAADDLDAGGESAVAEVEEEVREAERDEAPASSRRPVAPAPEERIAAIAFGSEEPPVGRTPPPKSGPLPAPPLDFDSDLSDVTGVRKSVPPEVDPREAPAPARLTPQIARLQVADGRDPIVDVVGEAQRFAPPSFAALLEASLSL